MKTCLALLLLISIPLSVWSQSSTTSAISGFVRLPSGEPLQGAPVSLLHEPTGSSYNVQTLSGGSYHFTGLRPGGPYRIEVSADGYPPEVRSQIFLPLGQEVSVGIRLSSAADTERIYELDAFTVEATNEDLIMSDQRSGPGTIIHSELLRQLPTVTRSLTDFTRLDPRISVYDRDTGAISAGGSNTRYNSLLIDGVPTNDSFGLNDNGLPSLKQPFSLDAIAEVSVETSPYSVEEAGFTGAAIRAITKSGSNRFSGSAYGYFRNTDMVGDLEDRDGQTVPFRDYTEYTAGLTLGGPIIKDKLFFFINYETVNETILQDTGDYVPDPDDLQTIIDFSKQVYGFDPGTIEAPGDTRLRDDKILIKLDWNITDKHQFKARYNLTESLEPRFPGYSSDSGTSLSSRWYDQVLKNRDYTFEFISSWSQIFNTELLVSMRRYTSSRDVNTRLPAIAINGVDGIDGNAGTINLGTDSNGHVNSLKVDTTVIRFKANLFLGNHTLTAGIQSETYDNENLFLSNAYGNWRYGELANYAPTDRTTGQFLIDQALRINQADNYNVAFPVGESDGGAIWSLTTLSAYIQDRWQPHERFNTTFGVRIDYPVVDNNPPQALGRRNTDSSITSFNSIFGIDNTATVDGNYVIQPRAGFNWSLDRDKKTQLRGGAGLFYGRAPHTWLSTSYVNNGNTQVRYSGARTFGNSPVFSADPDNPPLPEGSDSDDPLNPTNRRTAVDLVDPNFKMPTDWKYSLALDRKLPWLNFIFTAEVQWTRVHHAIHYQHLNLNPNTGNTELPDGRPYYNPNESRNREEGYGDVILLTNTDKGEGTSYTFQLRRAMRDNWSLNFGYTRTSAQSVNDGSGNSAFTNWSANVAPNINDQDLGTSRYQTRHRFISDLTVQIPWTEKHTTRVSLIYDGRSGRPFSYTYGANGFGSDINSDGNNYNDLIYVPSGIDDPIVAWGNQNNSSRDTVGVLFMDYIDSNPDLAPYKGSIVPRNTGQSPWIHQFDISITHEIKMWKGQLLELVFTIQNVGNLINSEWGLERRPKSPANTDNSNNQVGIVEVSRIPVPRFGKGNENGYYIYKFNSSYTEEQSLYETRSFSSRWAMLIGLRYSF